jgi:hypothetical protein
MKGTRWRRSVAGWSTRGKEPPVGGLLFLAFALFHHGPRCHFFGAFAIAAGTLSGFFDMLVLALLLWSTSSEMSFDCHMFVMLRGFLAA